MYICIYVYIYIYTYIYRYIIILVSVVNEDNKMKSDMLDFSYNVVVISTFTPSGTL